jgi:UDP-N-acetylglucosamine transferase subunit ALG13
LIFVTVGSVDPFDRLIRTMDEWAAAQGRSDVFAQIGKSSYAPKHIQYVHFLTPVEFRERIRGARLIVAHAGTGSIIAALEAGIPIIVMPKLANLGEHRNEHQVATAKRFGQKQGIIVANDERDLIVRLEQEEHHSAPAVITREASPELISSIRSFILGPDNNGKDEVAQQGLHSVRSR